MFINFSMNSKFTFKISILFKLTIEILKDLIREVSTILGAIFRD